MSKQKFWNPDETNPNILRIKELRQEATTFMSLNNAIIAELWDIDQKLLSSDTLTKAELLKQQQELNKILQTENYIDKIKALKERINDLEVQEFGKSDILDDSPGTSNNLI